MQIPILGYVHVGSYFIPTTFGLMRFKTVDKSMKVLTILCTFSCLNVVTQFILGRLEVNNHFLINAFIPIETLMILGVYFFSPESLKGRGFLIVGSVLFVLIWILDRALFDVPADMNTEMALISRLLLVVASCVIITFASRNESVELSRMSVFWVALGVILYSSGSFVIFGLGNALLKLNVTYFVAAWHINWSLIIAANLLYTKGISCKSTV